MFTKIKKTIQDFKYVVERIGDTQTKLADIEQRMSNPKVAAKMSTNGIETRLSVKLDTLQQLEADLLSNSLLLRLLRKIRVV
jgi:hypothetical protein